MPTFHIVQSQWLANPFRPIKISCLNLSTVFPLHLDISSGGFLLHQTCAPTTSDLMERLW